MARKSSSRSRSQFARSSEVALNRDIGQLESLIEELLTYARLDRPRVDLNLRFAIGQVIAHLQPVTQANQRRT
jgi:signal transduction histidine kinase